MFGLCYGCSLQRIKQSQFFITIRQVIMFQLVLSKMYLKHRCLISFCMDIHSISMPIAISYFILFFFWFIGIYYWATIVFWFFDFVVQVRFLAQCGVLTVAETTRNITKRLMPSSARHCCKWRGKGDRIAVDRMHLKTIARMYCSKVACLLFSKPVST